MKTLCEKCSSGKLSACCFQSFREIHKITSNLCYGQMPMQEDFYKMFDAVVGEKEEYHPTKPFLGHKGFHRSELYVALNHYLNLWFIWKTDEDAQAHLVAQRQIDRAEEILASLGFNWVY